MSGSAHQRQVHSEFLNKQKRLSLLEVSSVYAFVYAATQIARCSLSPVSDFEQQCCETEAFSSLFCVRAHFCTAQCRLKCHYFCFVHGGDFFIRELSCIGITCSHYLHQHAPDVRCVQKLDTKASTTLPLLSPCGTFFIFSALL
jgi:hypothetical protein